MIFCLISRKQLNGLKKVEQLRRDGTEILTRASNPATTVHKLVTYLIGQSHDRVIA